MSVNKELKIKDVVYGEISITDPVVIELINSPSLQRLKHIDMAGYSAGFYPGSSHTRFEHSVGVYHLLTKHGARLEERIHGLLHDVSHTAFSHAVDYALEGSSGARQDFQDSVFQSFVTDSEIPQILKKYDLDPEYVFDEDNFPLQENKVPDLCADRLDYSLRGLVHYGVRTLDETKEMIAALKSSDTDWYFESLESAKKYAQAFSDIDDKIYDSLTGAAMFRSIGDCVKYALENKIVAMNDLFSTDQEVIAKLQSRLIDDPQLAKLWSRMNAEVKFKDDANDFDAKVFCKSRIVDPKYLAPDGSLQRVSDAFPEWGKVVDEGLQPKTYHLKFLD